MEPTEEQLKQLSEAMKKGYKAGEEFAEIVMKRFKGTREEWEKAYQDRMNELYNPKK